MLHEKGQLEVLYRVYEVATEEEVKAKTESLSEYSIWGTTSRDFNHMLTEDVCICESRDHFKEIMRSCYGEDLKFAYSKKYPPGKIYVVIVGEHVFNGERYFNRNQFDCDYCGTHVETYLKKHIAFSDWEIRSDLYSKEEYSKMRFCSYQCQSKKLQELKLQLHPEEDYNGFVLKEDLVNKAIKGYIYKITKKSTGEFYVGQTMYAPQFRWVQHMKTSRFPLNKVDDYLFEVLEIVKADQDLLEREKYYIESCWHSAPELSLNISGTKNLSHEADQLPQEEAQKDE